MLLARSALTFFFLLVLPGALVYYPSVFNSRQPSPSTDAAGTHNDPTELSKVIEGGTSSVVRVPHTNNSESKTNTDVIEDSQKTSSGEDPEKAFQASIANNLTNGNRTGNVTYLSTCPSSGLCPVSQLSEALVFDTTVGNWVPNASGYHWCRPHALPLPLDEEKMLSKFQHKRILFLGDSIARNHFVVTMSRMCNGENAAKCSVRTPTSREERKLSPRDRGPVGCVPSSSFSSSSSPQPSSSPALSSSSAETLSPCYLNGTFAHKFLFGLTVNHFAKTRSQRFRWTRDGLIAPLLIMVWKNVTLLYLPITKPWQLQKAALWMKRGNRDLDADVMIVSIGPHLKIKEFFAMSVTLPPPFRILRETFPTTPILMAEAIHPVRTNWWKVEKYQGPIDLFMKELRTNLASLDVKIIPQRFITAYSFRMNATQVSEGDAETLKNGGGGKQLRCGYYDHTHPGYRCQMALGDVLLQAASACIQ